jgi:hypothetical protein
VTTQSPHLYARKPARAAAARPADSTGPADPAGREAGRPVPDGVQTRLPWWAVALPLAAFLALLALLSGAAPSSAADAASGGDVLARVTAALPDVVGHLL